jgi:hypothetical protein
MISKLASKSGHPIYYLRLPDEEMQQINVTFHSVVQTVVITKSEVRLMFADLETKGRYLMIDGNTYLEVKKYGESDVMFRMYPQTRLMTIEHDPETLIFSIEELKKALIIE